MLPYRLYLSQVKNVIARYLRRLQGFVFFCLLERKKNLLQESHVKAAFVSFDPFALHGGYDS